MIKTRDVWEVVSGTLGGICFAIILAMLITSIVRCGATSEKENAKMPPKEIHVQSSIYILDYCEYTTMDQGDVAFLSYTFNGQVNGISFHSEKEVKIFVKYLHTLGKVSFLNDTAVYVKLLSN